MNLARLITAKLAAQEDTRPYRNRVEVFGVDSTEGFPKVYGGRFKTGGFGVFGGGTDGDDLVAAAKREYLEETGYTLTDVEKMPIDAVTVEWAPPYKSAKQAERAKTYRGTRTWYMYGVITGPKAEKADGEDGASPLDNTGFYTCKTALEMLQGSTTENTELLPQIEARKKALLFVIAKSFDIKIEKLAEVTLDINKGDILLGGKYKNSPITVEEIGTDELGQPTVNGRKLLAYRIKKKMPEKTAASALNFLKAFIRRPLATQKAPLVPPVGREIVLGRIIAKLRRGSPQHAQKLQEMLRKRGLKNTADEMASGGFKAVPGMDVTKQAADTTEAHGALLEPRIRAGKLNPVSPPKSTPWWKPESWLKGTKESMAKTADRSRAPELAGAAGAASLPTAAAIQQYLRLRKLRAIIEKAKEISPEKMRELARAGDVVLESEPLGKTLHGGLHGTATFAAGSPLVHAELMGTGTDTWSGGHDVAAKGKTVHEPRVHRFFRGLEKGNPLAPLSAADEKAAARIRAQIDKVHAGKTKASPAVAGDMHSYFSELGEKGQPSMLMRRASGKALGKAEEAALDAWLQKSTASTYDAPGVVKNVLKGLFLPEFVRGGATKGFGKACKTHVCTSLAGDALKQLGGLQAGRNTTTLPTSLAVDPLSKVVGVTGKKALLGNIRRAGLMNAGVRAGVIGGTGLAGYGLIRALRGSPSKQAADRETPSQRVKEELRHILMGTMIAPMAQPIGSAVGATPFALAMKGLKDDVTPEDIKGLLAKVNKQRELAGMTPTNIVGSVRDTEFGKMLLKGDEQLNQAPGMRRLLKLLGKDPGAMLGKLEGSPGFQLEVPGAESFIYRSPKTNLGATGSVMAHELGHAHPAGRPGPRMSAFGRMLAPALLGMGAGGLGYSAGRKRKFKIEDAAMAGAGALGTGHTIREEMRASRFAKEQLKALGRNPKGLKRALLTYIVGSAGGAAAAGGLGYGLGKTGKKYAMLKVAKFMISKGPSTAQAYLDGWRKMLAAKALEKAPAEVAKKAPSAQKPTALAKLIKKKRKWKKSKKSKPLYGTPTGHGTAAFRFGD